MSAFKLSRPSISLKLPEDWTDALLRALIFAGKVGIILEYALVVLALLGVI